MSSVDINNFLPFLAVLVGGGAGVTLVAQLLKKVFKAQEAHVIHVMVVAVSVAAAAAQYVLQFNGKLPVDVLGISTPVIYGVSQFVYKEAGYANNFLSKVYSQAPDQPSAAGVLGSATTTKVAHDVETVVSDAKAVEHEFNV